ncbi:MAG TPA: SWIM zinc finger family protein [Candidatus Competibacter sp.]|nr:SWIM zinc finger family protein [Candidatus Competibacter sp.]
MSYDDYYFPASKPRRVSGGIKAQSQRGAFASRWWAKRWIAVLESFDIGARLGRGRSYARQGQVLDIQIAPGEVKAKVQGSRPRPYQVSIKLKPLSAAEWRKLAEAMAQEARFGAKLLAGEMPTDIEEVFRAEGLSLFPKTHGDLKTECSCPDYSNPCKHIAAVYYLLGEAFDNDPFLMFRLRGMEREALLAQLGEAVGDDESWSQSEPEPLPDDPSAFWAMPPLPESLAGSLLAPPKSAALLRRLGPFPFWRGDISPLDGLEPIYAAMGISALGALSDTSGEN